VPTTVNINIDWEGIKHSSKTFEYARNYNTINVYANMVFGGILFSLAKREDCLPGSLVTIKLRS